MRWPPVAAPAPQVVTPPPVPPKQPSPQNFQVGTRPSTGSRHAARMHMACTTRAPSIESMPQQPACSPCADLVTRGSAHWVVRLCRIAPHTHTRIPCTHVYQVGRQVAAALFQMPTTQPADASATPPDPDHPQDTDSGLETQDSVCASRGCSDIGSSVASSLLAGAQLLLLLRKLLVLRVV